MTEAEGEVVDPTSLFRILVSTDIHLGYGEKNEERAEDSFRHHFYIFHEQCTTVPDVVTWMKINVPTGHLLSC